MIIRRFLRILVGTLLLVTTGGAGWPTLVGAMSADSAVCADYQAWTAQSDPQTDVSGTTNTNYPEASSTAYWTTQLDAPIGSMVTVHGRFPLARFMSLETYSDDQLVDYIDDLSIVPDPGQNNPYLAGTDNGTYTVSVVVGKKPDQPSLNTLYTGLVTHASLMYRIYHATNPNDPAAGAVNPTLPAMWVNGLPLTPCPVQPIIVPEDASVWGRLDNSDWIGTPPTSLNKFPVANPPQWNFQDPSTAHFFPNGSNGYMGARLSRQYLAPYTTKNLYIVRFKAPTYPNTRGGEPIWLNRQVHFWSFCTDDPYTTNVNRCVPDDQVGLDAYGFATFIVSDPGSKPSDAALGLYKATWIAWGALNLPSDVVHDRQHVPWGINSPVHYYNQLAYRQNLANPTFAQSFVNVFALPVNQQKAAMGPYWPTGAYCALSDFLSYGPKCVNY